MALLTDFATLKQVLDLEKTEADYPQLTFVMNSVDAAIQSYLLRELEAAEYVEKKYLAEDQRMTALKALPVESVESVINSDDETIDPSLYKIMPYGLLFKTRIDGYLTVTYTGGEDEIHRDIKRAAELQAAYEYQNIDHIGAESVSNEGGSVQRPALGLLKEVKRMLNSHVHPMGVFL